MGDETERAEEPRDQEQEPLHTGPLIHVSGGFKTTNAIAALATALAIAQGGFTNPAKDKTAKVNMKNGGTYTFHYADLASVMDAVRRPLADNGLSIIQAPRIEYFEATALITLTTRLMHNSGEWIETEIAIGAEEQRAQVVASAVTYAKRYSIQALLGVVAEEDDDGNAASGNSANIQTRNKPQDPPAATKPPAAAQPAPAVHANVARFDKAKLSLSRKMGFDEAEHQIKAIKGKHPDTVPGKLAALQEIEALDTATPEAKS